MKNINKLLGTLAICFVTYIAFSAETYAQWGNGRGQGMGAGANGNMGNFGNGNGMNNFGGNGNGNGNMGGMNNFGGGIGGNFGSLGGGRVVYWPLEPFLYEMFPGKFKRNYRWR